MRIRSPLSLREQGLIRHIGLSNVNPDQFRAARQIVDIAAVTALYNIGDRTGPACSRSLRMPVVFSPWYPTTVANQGRNAATFGDVLGPICEKHHATVPQIALAWLLHRSPFMLPIPGTSSLTHLEENLSAAAIELTAEEVNAITHLVPEDQPMVVAEPL